MTLSQFSQRALGAALLLAVLVLSVQLVLAVNRVKDLKTDLGEIENVRYGLLDADQWVARLSAAAERRIDAFELTEANRPQIQAAVERVLNILLEQVEQYQRRRNLRSDGSLVDQLRGVLQQSIQDALFDFRDLRRQIPRYADSVVDELGKPEAKRAIKAQLVAFLRQTADSTFAKTDRGPLIARLTAHGCTEPAPCAARLRNAIAEARDPILFRTLTAIGLVAALFAVCLAPSVPRNRLDPPLDGFRLVLLTGGTLVLLAGGLLSPMLEIEARISQLSIQLLGEPVVFADQVLYFQTKSVFDVASLLVRTGKADMLLVALLLVLFSVVFPALKVVATFIYYHDFRGLRTAAAVRFFALRSGKWSMADVLVIAIFMSYIGFSGLVASQLGSLSQSGGAVEVLTTNGTTLAPGFFLFLAFVLASLVLSATVESRAGAERST